LSKEAVVHSQIVERLKERHRFAEWYGRNTLDQSLFVYGYLPKDGILPGWHMNREPILAGAGDQSRIHTIWQQAGEEAERLLKVDIYPRASREDAHDFAVQLLGNFQSPLIEWKPDSQIGDVAFAVPDDVAIVFSRANLVMFVASVGSLPAPVNDFAHRLDALLSAQPEATGDPQPVATRRLAVPESNEVRASFSVNIDASEPANQQTYWKFFSKTGEVILSEGQLVYRAKEPGAGHVDAYEIREDQAETLHKLVLQIEDDDSQPHSET
jgi:hypothetical protein